MDYGYSQEQEAYRARVKEFAAQAHLDRQPPERDEFDRRAWQACAAFGIQGGMVPRAYGGQGLDLLTYIAGLEQLGEACADTGLLFALCDHAEEAAVAEEAPVAEAIEDAPAAEEATEEKAEG